MTSDSESGLLYRLVLSRDSRTPSEDFSQEIMNPRDNSLSVAQPIHVTHNRSNRRLSIAQLPAAKVGRKSISCTESVNIRNVNRPRRRLKLRWQLLHHHLPQAFRRLETHRKRLGDNRETPRRQYEHAPQTRRRQKRNATERRRRQ